MWIYYQFYYLTFYLFLLGGEGLLLSLLLSGHFCGSPLPMDCCSCGMPMPMDLMFEDVSVCVRALPIVSMSELLLLSVLQVHQLLHHHHPWPPSHPQQHSPLSPPWAAPMKQNWAVSPWICRSIHPWQPELRVSSGAHILILFSCGGCLPHHLFFVVAAFSATSPNWYCCRSLLPMQRERC